MKNKILRFGEINRNFKEYLRKNNVCISNENKDEVSLILYRLVVSKGSINNCNGSNGIIYQMGYDILNESDTLGQDTFDKRDDILKNKKIKPYEIYTYGTFELFNRTPFDLVCFDAMYSHLIEYTVNDIGFE